MFPWAHAGIVFVASDEVVPGRTTLPLATPTAVATFVSLTLFKTIEPARLPFDGFEVQIKIGVLLISASIMACTPIVYMS